MVKTESAAVADVAKLSKGEGVLLRPAVLGSPETVFMPQVQLLSSRK